MLLLRNVIYSNLGKAIIIIRVALDHFTMYQEC